MRSLAVLALAVLTFLVFAPVVLAQWEDMGTLTSGETQDLGTVTSKPTPPAGSSIRLINPLKGDGTLESFLLNILEFVINIGSIIVVLMVVYVGFKFVVARGEPGKLTEARTALLWTVVGALVLLGSKAIAMGISATVKALGG